MRVNAGDFSYDGLFTIFRFGLNLKTWVLGRIDPVGEDINTGTKRRDIRTIQKVFEYQIPIEPESVDLLCCEVLECVRSHPKLTAIKVVELVTIDDSVVVGEQSAICWPIGHVRIGDDR